MTSFDKTLNLILIDFTSFKEWFFRMSSIFRGGSISVLSAVRTKWFSN